MVDIGSIDDNPLQVARLQCFGVDKILDPSRSTNSNTDATNVSNMYLLARWILGLPSLLDIFYRLSELDVLRKELRDC